MIVSLAKVCDFSYEYPTKISLLKSIVSYTIGVKDKINLNDLVLWTKFYCIWNQMKKYTVVDIVVSTQCIFNFFICFLADCIFYVKTSFKSLYVEAQNDSFFFSKNSNGFLKSSK